MWLHCRFWLFNTALCYLSDPFNVFYRTSDCFASIKKRLMCQLSFSFSLLNVFCFGMNWRTTSEPDRVPLRQCWTFDALVSEWDQVSAAKVLKRGGKPGTRRVEAVVAAD